MAKDLHVSALLDIYGNFLSEKQKELTEYYYNDDLSLSEIAENENITRQGVRDSIKRAQDTLNNLECKCHYCEKFFDLKELAQNYKDGDISSINKILNLIEDL